MRYDRTAAARKGATSPSVACLLRLRRIRRSARSGLGRVFAQDGDRLRLVAVEFIVDAATWLSHHATPPVLEGQTFQFVSSPNRYALPAFFDLHVWAWRHNPNGPFVDWNTRVTCERE